ncbi:ArsR/SmtB family transcription factor [Thermasporomyces composti]|jgi:DNA-binding transcriptional ArsR family regulator|uniref:ArsR family transcriptional regulator n=1 Tax=Thermasporomyces composti TaxID=696763 RepID=A0A3D9V9S7_THECX|nr:winged helix-turn-helix domain-containing protein [Thermasporomyces composti]REF37453.1 ArsR family transcriptional regulator [Thermasporomyces composti]
MVLRIHFTATDLARTRVAKGPDPLWEAVLSLHVLQSRRPPAHTLDWRARVRAEAATAGTASQIKHVLFPLAPVATYFPDFLTPSESADGIDAGVRAVASTPTSKLRQQIKRLASRVPVPGWTRALAHGDRRLRETLADALRAYHRTALAPWMDVIAQCVAVDREIRMRALADGGVERLLSSLGPGIRWEEPTLVADYPCDLDLHLDGRGLLLIPSYFCTRMPVALVDPDMQPVLVYPAMTAAVETMAAQSDVRQEALADLLGATRAVILTAIADGYSGRRLAAQVGVSPATISHHTAVLREAGLITSARRGNTVVHRLTMTGARLLGRVTGPDRNVLESAVRP